MRFGIYVLVDRTFGCMEFGCIDCSFQFHLGRIHQRRVECTAHFQGKSTFGSGCFHQFTGLVDAFDRTGNNDLSRTVVVGCHANFTFSCYGSTDFFYFFIRKGDDGCHGRRLHFTSLLHGHGTCINQFQSVFERKGTCGNQGREFTQ